MGRNEDESDVGSRILLPFLFTSLAAAAHSPRAAQGVFFLSWSVQRRNFVFALAVVFLFEGRRRVLNCYS